MGISLEDDFNKLAAWARKQARITLAGTFEFEVVKPDAPFIESWRIRIGHANSEWIILSVKPQFPLELPTVFVEDLSLYERAPHISQNGELCYCDKATSSFCVEDVKEIVLWVVDKCKEVLDKADTAANDDEFAIEYHSYWRASRSFLSLLTSLDEVRELDVLWLAAKQPKGFSFLACEDTGFAKQWLKQSGIGTPTAKDRALFLPNAMPPRPPFPATNRDLYDQMQSLPTRKRWESYVRNRSRDRLVISTVNSSRGPSLIAFTVPYVPSDPDKPRSFVVKGFRPGKHPLKLEMHGWAGSAELRRYEGERIDLARLTSRTVGSQPAGPKHLIIIGAGSIGSNLLLSLIKSHHFERVSLIDPDILTTGNVLRHTLGFTYVGSKKAEALAIEVGRQCPWLTIDAISKDVLLAASELQNLVRTADLIILATGNNVVERAIVPSLLRQCQSCTSVIRLWFTGNADVGVLLRYVAGKPGCPQCVVEPKHTSSTVMYEPGCSAGFAQFGGSRLARFVALCADQALLPAKSSQLIEWTPRPIDRPDLSDEVRSSPLERSAKCPTCD